MQHSKVLHEKGLIRSKSMLTQSGMSQFIFLAKLDNIKTFYTALKAINFHDDATIIISSDGFKAIVEESKYVQASMYVTRACFSDFQLRADEDLSVRINLSVFTDCLSIFANPDCSMKIMYKGASAPLVLVLEQHDGDDLITEVSIKTKNGEEHMDYNIDEDDEYYNSLIVRGPDFSHLFNDIHKATEELEITIAPKSPYFAIESLGQLHDEVKVEIAKSSDMFISYYCGKESKARYKMTHIRLTLKALSIASKVALRTDRTGLLGLQIMVVSDGDSQIYIEYFITPLIDELE
ncbi:cell cycle checkpoint protein RAD1 [Sitodiplosis mosellana]|uniref:cell cycle checkpoint protein RAD1 n=1 Tax=Sitodiplosis mosellana TaxID=263140 RepID=UPI0024440956|nr:cell cycle checkpoint protein RAD1 [Sitodiplosis mosellana]